MSDDNTLALPVDVYGTYCVTYDDLCSAVERGKPERFILFKEKYRKHRTMWLLSNL
jgi:hypothetical protein